MKKREKTRKETCLKSAQQWQKDTKTSKSPDSWEQIKFTIAWKNPFTSDYPLVNYFYGHFQ